MRSIVYNKTIEPFMGLHSKDYVLTVATNIRLGWKSLQWFVLYYKHIMGQDPLQPKKINSI